MVDIGLYTLKHGVGVRCGAGSSILKSPPRDRGGFRRFGIIRRLSAILDDESVPELEKELAREIKEKCEDKLESKPRSRIIKVKIPNQRLLEICEYYPRITETVRGFRSRSQMQGAYKWDSLGLNTAYEIHLLTSPK